MTGARQLRILCLHGYHGSAATLRNQMAGMVSAMPSNIEFVYLDAPSLARGDFGWWHEGFSGWEQTRQWAINLFESQPPFDGLFGFSQGAALTGLLAAVNESEYHCESGESWFDFAVMVGGFKSDSPRHAELFERGLALPSVHVMGRGDGIVPIGDSRILAGAFEDPLVIEHSGGHIVPGIDTVTHPLAHFLTDRMVPTCENSLGESPRIDTDRIQDGSARHG